MIFYQLKRKNFELCVKVWSHDTIFYQIVPFDKNRIVWTQKSNVESRVASIPFLCDSLMRILSWEWSNKFKKMSIKIEWKVKTVWTFDPSTYLNRRGRFVWKSDGESYRVAEP